MVPSDVAKDKEKIVMELLAKRGWKLTLDWLAFDYFHFCSQTLCCGIIPIWWLMKQAQKGSMYLKSHSYQIDSTVRPRRLVFSFLSVFVFHHSAFIPRTAPLGKDVINRDRNDPVFLYLQRCVYF